MQDFVNFYNENKKKIYMPYKVNYPLNYKKATHWANSQCDIDSVAFAHDIIKHTLYVPFSAFMNKLTQICEIYVAKYSKPEYKNDIFLLVLPFSVHKSNMWVSMLAFAFLKKIITDICYDITLTFNSTLDKKSNIYGRNVHCIICDDCIYTGNQIISISSLEPSILDFPGKTAEPDRTTREWLVWHVKTKQQATKYIAKIPKRKFSVDHIVPYVSVRAQDRIKSIPYINASLPYITFPIFSSQIKINKIPTHVINKFKRTFQYHEDISVIYFDHKIADAVSTFNKVYLMAPLFGCQIQTSPKVKFIEYCGDVKIPPDINIYNFYNDIEKTSEHAVCPPSFYKRIKYTYSKKPVEVGTSVADLLILN